MIVLNDEQMVLVAACVAAGFASTHDEGAVDVFYRTLAEVEAREESKASEMPDLQVNI